ncbi:MAG: sodium:proton antiporter [Desulfurococcaceae archaeon]|uniref:Na+/H+ antiporter subunit C n=1 Tax=Staphylothermus marinus TaxID=2280 RepID=A0A7C4D8M0_STAMA
MINPVTYFLSLILTALIVNLGLSLYGVFFRPSLIKKIIALTIFSDTANTFAILIGFRRWVDNQPSIPPVIVGDYTSEIIQKEFIKRSVDPLPQALVLTAIVIGLAVTLFLVFLTLQIYRTYGTLDIREIRRLRG